MQQPDKRYEALLKRLTPNERLIVTGNKR